MANGHHFAFGRTQIVVFATVVVMVTVGVAWLCAMVNVSFRGFVHNFLASALALASFAVVLTAIVHLVLRDAFEDSFTFFTILEQKAGDSANQACGSTAISSIGYLKQVAMNQFVNLQCSDIGAVYLACAHYFNCTAADICGRRRLGEDISMADLGGNLQSSKFLVYPNSTHNGTEIPPHTVSPFLNIFSCALGDCDNTTAAHTLANNVLVQQGAVAVIINKIEVEVEPYVTCQIGLSSWTRLLAHVNTMSDAAQDVLVAANVWLVFIWIAVFGLVPASKRFTVRNHFTHIERRRKRRLAKNRKMVEKVVSEWMDVDGGTASRIANLSIVAPLFNNDQLFEIQSSVGGDGGDGWCSSSDDDDGPLTTVARNFGNKFKGESRPAVVPNINSEKSEATPLLRED
jgi:hypothetical protein